MLKRINLQKFYDSTRGFTEILGGQERQVLQDACLLLKGQFPGTEPDKRAYLTRSTQVQADLINLQSTTLYILNQLKTLKEARWGKLVAREEYIGKDREAIALAQDDELRDLTETIAAFEAVKSAIDNCLWSCKIA